MKDTPLISIIIPVYNVEHYLDKCLESVCGQTYTNLEIILVDDGSTDKSGEICDAYAAKDARIKVIHQENVGQSAARNVALEVAQGDFLGFVDSDDWIEPDMYRFLYLLLDEYNSDISVCAHYRDKDGKSSAKFDSGKVVVYDRDEAIRQLVVDKHLRNYMVDKLYKRSLFEEIKFPIGRIYEDLAISYQVFYNASKIVIKDVPQYHYVIRRGSSLQSKYNPQREYQLVQAVNEQVDFVIKHAIMPVDIASYYIVRRCIRFIDHLSLVPMTPQVQYFVDDALTKIRCYANVDKVLLGHSLAIKRRFITRHLPAYQKCYRFVVKLLKFKRK